MKSQILKKIRNSSQHSSLILGELYNIGDIWKGSYHILLGVDFDLLCERCEFTKDEISYMTSNFFEMDINAYKIQPLNLGKLIMSHYSEYYKFLPKYVDLLQAIIIKSYGFKIEPYRWKAHYTLHTK